MDASERSLASRRTLPGSPTNLPDPKLTPAHYDLTSESSGDSNCKFRVKFSGIV